MIIPLSDPVEYLTRRKFPSYPHVQALDVSLSSISTSGMSPEKRQRLIKDIESYKSELRAKPPEELQALYRQEQQKERQELEAKAELDEQQRFFNQPDAKADFRYWSKAAYWTLDEAIALSFGKAPEVVKWENLKKYVGRSPFVAKYGRVRELALRAKAWKQLYDPVLPGLFLAWARKNDIEVQSELIEQVEVRGIVIADWKDMFDKLNTKTDEYRAGMETLLAAKDGEIAELTQERDALREARAEGRRGGSAPGPKWPWGDYETEWLRHLAAAADRFWRNYDPSDATTAPTNQQVMDWLKGRGVSDRVADVMATILRATTYLPGRASSSPRPLPRNHRPLTRFAAPIISNGGAGLRWFSEFSAPSSRSEPRLFKDAKVVTL